mgnify:CR=1 FL=1
MSAPNSPRSDTPAAAAPAESELPGPLTIDECLDTIAPASPVSTTTKKRALEKAPAPDDEDAVFLGWVAEQYIKDAEEAAKKTPEAKKPKPTGAPPANAPARKAVRFEPTTAPPTYYLCRVCKDDTGGNTYNNGLCLGCAGVACGVEG